jgi:hypothetical protein
MREAREVRFPVGNYQALLWNKKTVVLSVKGDGAFRMRFTEDDGTLSGRLSAQGAKWALLYDGGRGPVGESCFPEGSLLAVTPSGDLQGECRIDNEIQSRTFQRLR